MKRTKKHSKLCFHHQNLYIPFIFYSIGLPFHKEEMVRIRVLEMDFTPFFQKGYKLQMTT